MDEQNLDRVSAALRNIRKGDVDRPIKQEDIDLQKRELPEKEVDVKVAQEKKQRKKEIEDIKKSEAETQFKKKIAEDSIKKLREGGIFDRKQRIENLKSIEKDFRQHEKEEEGASFEDLLTDSQRQAQQQAEEQAKNVEPTEIDETAEFDDSDDFDELEKEASASEESTSAPEQEEEVAEESSETSDDEISDTDWADEPEEVPEETPQDPPTPPTADIPEDTLEDVEDLPQDEQASDAVSNAFAQDEEVQDDEYVLDSDQEALPSLDEMNIEDTTLDGDFFSNADDEEPSQDSGRVGQPTQAELQPDEISTQDEAPLDDSGQVDTFIDNTEKDLEKEVSDQSFDEPSDESFDEESDELLQDPEPEEPEVPVEINTDIAIPVIDNLDSFDKVEAQKTIDQLKQTFLAPLLKTFRYKKGIDTSLEAEKEDDDLQEFSLDEQTDVDDIENGENLKEEKSLSEEERKQQAESFLLGDFDEPQPASEDVSQDQSDKAEEAEEPLEDLEDQEEVEPQPVDTETTEQQTIPEEEVEPLSFDDDFGSDQAEPVLQEKEEFSPKSPPKSQKAREAEEAYEDEVKKSTAAKTSAPSFGGAGAAPKEIDQEEVDKLLGETEVDEVDFENISKNVDYSLAKSKPDETLAEDNYEKAFAIINSYETKNRNLIIDALSNNRLSSEDSDRICDMVLQGSDEDSIAAFIQNQIYQKTYRENLKEDLADRAEEEELVEKYQKNRKILGFVRLIAASIFIVATAFFIVFYGIDMVRSEITYRSSYANMEDNRYDIGEEKFEEAYKIMPSVRWINRIADLYIDRGLFLDAEKKYLRGLDFDPQNQKILNEYGEMLTLKGDYSRAYGKFREALQYHPGNIESEKGLAQNFIEWGIENEARWVEGDKILSQLVSQDSKNKLFYLSKKLEIASLRRNYPTSKFYYEKIQEADEEYIDKKSLRRYSQFLIDHYSRINTVIGDSGIDQSLRKQNNYIVATIQDITEKVFTEDPNYLPSIYTTANWFHVLDQDDKAMIWVQRGIDIVEKKNQPVVYRERFSPTHFYNLEGQIFYEKGDFYSSLESFQNSIDYNQNDAFANYYLGRIDLMEFDDLVKAEEKLGRAYINWDLEKNDAYRDLLYSYGYVNYKQGRIQLDQEKLERALGFWNQLLNDQQITHSESVEFALSLTYLGLERYDLAEAFIDESIQDITPDLDYFQKSRGEVPDRVLERVKMLSDNYNNLGVVQVSKALSERQRNRYINKQKAIEHFIDSITLKDELNLLKGVPYANFNRINNFPQVQEDFFLSDGSLPKTLLP